MLQNQQLEQPDLRPPEPDETINLAAQAPKSTHWWQLRLHWLKLSRRQKWLVAGFTVLLIGGIFFGAAIASKHAGAPSATYTDEQGKPILSPLTGVPVSAAEAARPVTAIMIENSPDARPQSGLQNAGLVFEAIAEGGITRFVALFQEGQPNYVGPVRSLRNYYLDWASAYQAGIAHVGGETNALKRVRSGHFRDLDQFFNPGAYWRVASRPAPHNVYTSFDKLDALNKSKGYKHSQFEPWARQQPTASVSPDKVTASKINLTMSGPLYNVNYRYSPQTNTYRRYEAGAQHLVTKSERGKPQQLQPKVVIAMVTSYGIARDGHHSAYQTTGKGTAFIFQDGKVIKTTWKKKTPTSMLRFLDAEGKEVLINAGQTWVTAVGARSDVHYGLK